MDLPAVRDPSYPLPPHMPPPPPLRRGSSPTVVIVSLLLIAGLAFAIWYAMNQKAEVTDEQPILHTVVRARFEHVVLEQGEVESAKNIEIRCRVKARNSSGTAILWVIDEGTQVFAGGDTNNDDKLDAAELDKLPEPIKADVSAADANQDRTITRDELIRHFTKIKKKPTYGPDLDDAKIDPKVHATAAADNVFKGQLLVTLDDSALEQEMIQQEIAVNTVKALMVNAKGLYEASVIAKKEYLEGTFEQDQQTYQSEIFVAEDSLKKAELDLDSAKRLLAKGLLTPLQLSAQKFAVQNAKNQLSGSQTKLRVLRKLTKAKMLKQLDSDTSSTKAKWDAELKSHQLEKNKLQDIRKQMRACEIRAPEPGQVVHANVSSRRGNNEFVVEAGSLVRQKQVIIRLPNTRHMQVKTKVNESRITLVKEGMPVTITLGAFDHKVVQGRVKKVNKYSEPSSWWSSQVKEFATFVEILDPPKEIRTGMTAEVQIFVEQKDNVLQIPVQAIYEHREHLFCLVSRSADQWETKEIQIGSSNDKNVTVIGGIEEGDQVVLNPRRHLDKMEFPEIPDLEAIQRRAQRTPKSASAGE